MNRSVQAQKEAEDLNIQRKEAAESDKKAFDAAEPARKAAEAKAKADDDLKAALAACGSVDTGMMRRVLAAVQVDTGNATAAYIAVKEAYQVIEGEKLEDLAADEEGEEAEPTAQLRYLAATEGHEWMLQRSMVEGQGVTFPCWVLPEPEEDEEEEEDDEDDEEEKAPKPAPELPLVQIQSVLHDGPVKFHGIPKLGGYVAVPLRYTSLLHGDALPEVPEDMAPEEEEEEDEDAASQVSGVEGKEGKDDTEGKAAEPAEVPVLPGVPKEVDLALCVDSVGQNRAFTEEQVQHIKTWAGLLKNALERTEAAAYEADWRALEALRKKNTELLEDWENTTMNIAEEVDSDKAAQLEDAGDEPSDELVALLDASAPVQVALRSLAVPEVAAQWAPIAQRKVPPAGDALKVLCAVAHMLGASKADLGDANSRAPTLPVWSAVQTYLGADALNKVQSFVPEAKPASEEEVPPPYVAPEEEEEEEEVVEKPKKGKKSKKADTKADKKSKAKAAEKPKPAVGGAAAGAGDDEEGEGAVQKARRDAEGGPVDAVAVAEALEGVDREGLLKGTYNSALVLALLFDWAGACVAASEAAVAFRAKLRADHEARLAAEEEARAEAEAAAAAAAAEEAEEEEDDD